jgi:hypothetical protein
VLLLDDVDEFQFNSGHVISDEFGIQFVHDHLVPSVWRFER